MVFALVAGATMILDPAEVLDHPAVQLLAGSLVLMPIVMACLLALRFRRNHRSEGIRTRTVSRL
ncbi:MAG TPA: hypothetical protein DEQ49_13835, partial [Arthrobacter bacterium]|nr:hypothetical protein [Arthrobacter sp.]